MGQATTCPDPTRRPSSPPNPNDRGHNFLRFLAPTMLLWFVKPRFASVSLEAGC
jgi:hypothetical protein